MSFEKLRSVDGSAFYIGLMSGTSCDAVDAALVRIAGPRVELLRATSLAMPESTRRRVERVVSSATAVRHSGAVDVAGVDVKEDQSSPWDSWEGEREADGTSLLCQLNAELTMLFAAAVEKIFEEEELELGETSDDSDERPRGREAVRKADVAAVGCHGQTVCHIPRIDESRGWNTQSTLQLVDVGALAAILEMRVVGNFRPADMAVGGVGAPLMPFVDAFLLANESRPVACQNLGGIGNVTAMFPGGADVIAFDTGPGNCIMDLIVRLHSMAGDVVRNCDLDGRMAQSGTLSEPLLARMQTHPFLKLAPPRATGREDFGIDFVRKMMGWEEADNLSVADMLRTALEFTAVTVADAYARYIVPRLPADGAGIEVVFTGGGAHNPVLMERIVALMPEQVRVRTALGRQAAPTDDLVEHHLCLSGDAKEAIGFAVLAHANLSRVPAGGSSWTGGRRPVVLGVMADGRPLE